MQGYGQTEARPCRSCPRRTTSTGQRHQRAPAQVCGGKASAPPSGSSTSTATRSPRTARPPARSGPLRSQHAGYWNKPELTAQTLRDGWMWTGDVAVWDEDHYVYIVDRPRT
ncbi:long-chain fatty acid--CoA ligase [Rhodococcus ruber]|nr:long-chain fatty acid--CoA ligase [Rhodococcus ruber]